MSFSLSATPNARSPRSSSLHKPKSPPTPKILLTQFLNPLLKSPAFPLKTQSSVPLSPHAKHNHANPVPNVPLLEFSLRKLAFFALGSVLSFASFNTRPAMADLGTKTAPLEEKLETQTENDEDEGGYMEILKRNPGDVEALKMVLYGKMRKGKMDEAVKFVEMLVDVEPEQVEWRLLQALSYEMMGQLGKAKTLFKEILKERPLLIRALHGLALVMHKNREGPAVFEMLNKALELAKREDRVTEELNIKILIAQMHVVKGDLAGGLDLFKKLAVENPGDFRPFLCQGIIYSLLDKKEEADKQFGIYQALVPEEFPQRGFLDDVILSAKTESREKLQKDFEVQFSSQK